MEKWRLSHVKFCEKCNKYFYPNATIIEVKNNCPYCSDVLQDTGMTYNEYSNQTKTSPDVLILKNLEELKETDPVKYEIAMTKYKNKITRGNQNSQQNIPKCPICNSTNIHKISGVNKVGSALAFGVFAVGHVNKTWKCDNCGSKF